MGKNMRQKGFTLLELLVVIAVIGILAGTIISTSIRGTLQARDTRRIQELYQIVHGLQLYYSTYGQYPDNTDSGDIDCWGDWDAGNIVNGEADSFIKPLSDEEFLLVTPKEWRDIKDGGGSQCIYRYLRVTDPCCGCSGTYAVLYGACEAGNCPVNERPTCCTCWDEGAGDNDPYDIAIFLRER